MIRQFPLLVVVLVASFLPTASAPLDAQRSFEPERPDPLEQPWRWRAFPELHGRELRSIDVGPGPVVWFGVRGGVLRYDGVEWKEFSESDGLVRPSVNDILVASDGRVYAGTNGGLFRLDSDRWRPVWPAPGQVPTPVLELVGSADGTLWAATEWGALHVSRDGSSPVMLTASAGTEALSRLYPGLNIRPIPDRHLSPRPWGVGVGIAVATAAGEFPGLSSTPRRVAAVAPGGPADRLGIEPGDRLVLGPTNRTLWPGLVLRGDRGDTLHARVEPAGDGDAREVHVPVEEIDGSTRLIRIRSILPVEGDRLWLGLRDGGVLEIDGPLTSAPAWTLHDERRGLTTSHNPHLARGTDGSIWVASTNALAGLFRFQEGRWRSFDLTRIGGNHRNSSVHVSEDGTVWVGGLGVVHRYDGGRWRVYQTANLPIPTAPTVVAEDETGALWIGGMGQEAVRVDRASTRWEELEGLLIQEIRADGTRWYVSDEGGVVRDADGRWTRWGVEDGLMSTPVAVRAQDDGTIWAAGSHDGVAAVARLDGDRWERRLFPALSWSVDYRSVAAARDGGMWFGAAVDLQAEQGQVGGLLHVKDGAWTHLRPPGPPGPVYGIAETDDGRLWAASPQGLFVRDADGWGRVRSPEPLLGGRVVALYRDRGGALWVGTRGQGLFRLDASGWTRFTHEDGLVGDGVVAIEEAAGVHWVATRAGFSRWDGETWTPEALPGEIPSSRRIVLRSGPDELPRIGVLVPDPDRPFRVNRLESNLRALTVRILRDRSAPRTVIDDPPDRLSHPGNLVASWSGSDAWKVTPAALLEFSYRLDDEPWSPFARRTQAPLLDLSGGEHRLQVRARDMDLNVESTPATAMLVVEHPVWAQAWFQALIALLLGAVAVQSYRTVERGRALRAANARLEERVADRTRELEETNRALQAEIEERKDLQDQLIQAQKLEAVGRMAGGIAHDFNNLLTAITGYADLIRAELSEDHRAVEDLDEVTRAAGRARDLVRQLLTFSRKETIHPVVLDVNEQIRDVTSLLEQLLGEGVRLELTLADETLPVHIDPTHFEQVVVNLAVNAREAMEGAGTLAIGSERLTGEAPEAAVGDAEPGGVYARVSVADTGPGIPAEHREQIFDPFFTTKEEGSGLGLSTVYGIVTRAGGFIEISSGPDGGTRFDVHLPLVEDRESPPG